ncbi:helix-turn-helix domain-containing protein [Variovorax sp. LT1R20]|uniref:helix-turn-helix domain-containing protein n=1 Tax=Variovorax sp. LT1R20 TaxID=3443729 RepID=UPI003F456E19
MNITATMTAKAPEVASNVFDWQQHRVATPEPLPIPSMPVIAEIEAPAESDAYASPAAAGDPFAGLVPNAARAAQPAANDDTAPADQVEPALGQKRKSARVKNAVFEGRAEMQLRRITSERLIRAREASGYGQREAASEMGYETPAQLSQWESGRRFPPTSELIKLANLYLVSIDFLLGQAPEMHRDHAAGLRTSMLRGVRTQLSRCAEVVVAEVSRHARLAGVDSGSREQFIAAGAELLDAVRGLERLNRGCIDDMRGGATLAFKSEAFEQALHDARRHQRLAQALDNDLRERLGRLPDGDIDLGVEA